MKFFIFLFIIAISVNNGFYNDLNIFFGKNDIVNYQKLIQSPDLFHLNTYVLNLIFGERIFFNYIMPFIIFIIFPYSINLITKDHKKTVFICTSTGLFFFYWIIGLYSQCIAHIFFNLYLATKKKRWIIIAVLNHPLVLATYGIIHKKYFYLIASCLIVYLVFPNEIPYYTVFRPDQNILGMLLTLMNPLLWFNKKSIDLNHYIGLISSNMRVTMFTLPLKVLVKNYKQYQLSSYIWFTLMFLIHYYMMLQDRLT